MQCKCPFSEIVKKIINKKQTENPQNIVMIWTSNEKTVFSVV